LAVGNWLLAVWGCNRKDIICLYIWILEHRWSNIH
jgi:hypothetical protein